ncbi:MAG: transporter substrate-binding protein [Hyphomicrobiales bacterium]|nr:transporter substrate-binding protein [Hyphomicrobiales bacterium]
MFTRRTLVASLCAAAALPARAQAPGKLRVVASFSILGDFVREVSGARADVAVLVGPGADAHVYSATPADAKALAAAQVVVVNGLKFEGWMDRLVSASKTRARIVVAAKGVKPLQAQDDGHGHGDSDPHAWQSIANARIYVANIRDGLVAADPPGRGDYEANAAAYLAKLDALEAETKAAVAAIPPARRKIITSHDAFGYFAAAYGLTFIAPQGVSTSAAASAQDVARIIRQIRRDKIPAVFVENLSDPRLAQRIAAETGARLGGDLYSDQLSPPDGPAGTYIDMVRHNIRELTKALAD